MEQFVFFWVKDSVAAVKMESSWMGFSEEEGEAGDSSEPGEGGGVGYADCWAWDWACHNARKVSSPLTLGRSHWYVMGFEDGGVSLRTCSRILDEFAI